MNRQNIAILIAFGLLTAGYITLDRWVLSVPVKLEIREPGADGIPEGAFVESGEEAWEFKGELTKGDGKASDILESWSMFRGDDCQMYYDNSAIDLAREWPENGPPVIWDIPVGDGYAGAAIRQGRVYLLDYDEKNQGDVIRCLSLDDGQEIWRYFYSVKVKRDHGMSRTVPAVTDEYVVTLGPRAQVVCLKAETGEYVWHIDLVSAYGTEVPLWHAAQCPVIEDGRAIIAPAGPKGLMIAVECSSGDIVWTAANPDNWEMTHTSILPVKINDQAMYVYCGGGGVAGVAKEDGHLLWKNTDWKMRTNVPSPLYLGESRFYLCAGYNKGSMTMDVKWEGDRWQAETVNQFPVKVFGTVQHSPVYYQGHLYGIREKGKQLICLDRNGAIVWESGSAHTFGDGPVLLANGLIYILDDDGTLFMIEASQEGYRELGQAQVFNGHDAWGPMAMVAGRLILRDFDEMKCLDMRQNTN